ncbi:hypothetical protein [Spongiactinospora sp. TRM90649]|uniref:hypothetical protein n=1 Tax=Spongiactinospora sp. TRM90649 TaxID=3031114 RepID=UPI0023F8DD3B|nr:hypothetical protein [Spongiactinospora sp. TRM90649]MDF5751675.1 hypothetical protein [Spongiactinospora sp. TRM90649]
MTSSPWSCPFVYAVGVDTGPDEPPGELAAFNDFYDAHLDDVVARTPGFVCAERYELADGTGGPRWLAVYGVDGEEPARRFVERATGPVEDRVKYPPGPPAWTRMTTVWRLIWRRAAWTGALAVPAGRVALIGMNPAPGATGPEISDFDDFYTGVHLPEIISKFAYDRGSRFALWHELRHPAPGCPANLALYEAEVAPVPPAAPALTPGPPAWEGREVRWRLKYDRIGK